jgi:hypothetical protein
MEGERASSSLKLGTWSSKVGSKWRKLAAPISPLLFQSIILLSPIIRIIHKTRGDAGKTRHYGRIFELQQAFTTNRRGTLRIIGKNKL